MSSPDLRPAGGEQSDKGYWVDRAAQLKQQLMERRLPTSTVQPENMSSSQGTPEHPKQEKQPSPDPACPTQIKTTVIGQAQSKPGLSHEQPSGREMPKETSQLKNPPTFSPPQKSTSNGSAQKSAALTGKPVGKPAPSKPFNTTRNRMNDALTNDALTAENEDRGDANAPLNTNTHAAITVPKTTDASACSRVQQGEDSTASKEKCAPQSTTKSTAVPEDQSNSKSSIEEGEIIPNSSTALDKNPIQEPTPQQATRTKTVPTSVSMGMGTSIDSFRTRAERRVSGPPEATPASRHRGVQGDTATARSSAPRTEARNGHRRASSPVRAHRTDHNYHMTWESYKTSPHDHHTHPRAGRGQRHQSASPVMPWLIDGDGDREVERLASRYPDLRDWLELTGWHVPDYRMRQLDRLRRMAEIEQAKSQLQKEFDREKARLEGYGDPASKATYLRDAERRPMPLPRAPTRPAGEAQGPKYSKLGPYPVTDGLKRKRSEESDDGGDGSFSPKYCRTSRNHRGSRADYHGSRGSHHRGREDPRYWQDRERRRGGRSPPHGGFPEGSSPRSLPQRNSRQPYRFSSPVGHPQPRNDFDAESANDWYMTRDRSPELYVSPRFGSSPPKIRGYFRGP